MKADRARNLADSLDKPVCVNATEVIFVTVIETINTMMTVIIATICYIPDIIKKYISVIQNKSIIVLFF